MCFLDFIEKFIPDADEYSNCHRFRVNRTVIAPLNLQGSRVHNGVYVWNGFVAEGGQGLVNFAYNPFSSTQTLIIKTISQRPDRKQDSDYGSFAKRMSAFKTSFRKEAKIIQSLNHPNIAKLIDWWEEFPEDDIGSDTLSDSSAHTLVNKVARVRIKDDDLSTEEGGSAKSAPCKVWRCRSCPEHAHVGDIYQVMLAYEGDLENLLHRDFIDTIKQVDLVKSVAGQILNALEHCHSFHGLLHRDIKPGNILWRTKPDQKADNPLPFHFVLADFGLAKYQDKPMNPAWRPKIYYWYPPEYYTYPVIQSAAGDIWMLAVTLLWLVDEQGLRTLESGELMLTEVWDKVELASQSPRWKDWAGLMARDPNLRMTPQEFAMVTDNLRRGPDLEGTVPRQEEIRWGGYNRWTFNSPQHTGVTPGYRCWHSEINFANPSTISPGQRCHC